MLSLTDERKVAKDGEAGVETTAIEAIVGDSSSLIGWSAQRLLLYERFNVNLLAVSRKGERLDQRLGAIPLRLGNIVVLQGKQNELPERSEEHTSELQSLMRISYAVFCLKKKNIKYKQMKSMSRSKK